MGNENLSCGAACTQPENKTSITELYRFLQQHKSLFLESLIDNLSNHYFFWKDANCRYLGCSLSFAELVGLENPEDIISKTDRQLRWPSLINMSSPQWVACLEEQDQQVLYGDRIRAHEIVLNLDNRLHNLSPRRGPLTLLLTQMQIMSDDGSEVMGMVGFLEDISHLRRVESTLGRQYQQQFAHYLQCSLARVTALQHDTEEPLAALTDIVNQLDRNSPAHEIARRSVLTLRRTIDEAREEHRQLFGPYEPEPVLLHTVVQEALKAHEKKLHDQALHAIDYQADHSALNRYVLAEALPLKRLLVRLLSHALALTLSHPDGAEVTSPIRVALSMVRDRMQLTIRYPGEPVSDNGLAIAHGLHFAKAAGGEFGMAPAGNRHTVIELSLRVVDAPEDAGSEANNKS